MAKGRTNNHEKRVDFGSNNSQPFTHSNQQPTQLIQNQRQHLNTGRWSHAQCMIFQQKYPIYGNDWHAIAQFISTRDHQQVRSHAQKYETKKGKRMQRIKQQTEGLLRIKQFGDKIVTRRRAGDLLEEPKKKKEVDGKKKIIVKKPKGRKREEIKLDTEQLGKNKKIEAKPRRDQMEEEDRDIKSERQEKYYQQLIQIFGFKWFEHQISSVFQPQKQKECSQIQTPRKGFVFVQNPFQIMYVPRSTQSQSKNMSTIQKTEKEMDEK